jgi:hypothetical protein
MSSNFIKLRNGEIYKFDYLAKKLSKISINLGPSVPLGDRFFLQPIEIDSTQITECVASVDMTIINGYTYFLCCSYDPALSQYRIQLFNLPRPAFNKTYLFSQSAFGTFLQCTFDVLSNDILLTTTTNLYRMNYLNANWEIGHFFGIGRYPYPVFTNGSFMVSLSTSEMNFDIERMPSIPLPELAIQATQVATNVIFSSDREHFVVLAFTNTIAAQAYFYHRNVFMGSAKLFDTSIPVAANEISCAALSNDGTYLVYCSRDSVYITYPNMQKYGLCERFMRQLRDSVESIVWLPNNILLLFYGRNYYTVAIEKEQSLTLGIPTGTINAAAFDMIPYREPEATPLPEHTAAAAKVEKANCPVCGKPMADFICATCDDAAL